MDTCKGSDVIPLTQHNDATTSAGAAASSNSYGPSSTIIRNTQKLIWKLDNNIDDIAAVGPTEKYEM
jgi:hypothetical protein